MSGYRVPTLDIYEATVLEGTGIIRIICATDNFRDLDEMWLFQGMPSLGAFNQLLFLQRPTRQQAGIYRCQLYFEGNLLESVHADFELVVECE